MGIWEACANLLSDFKNKIMRTRSSERLLERLAPMPQVLLSSIQPNDQNIIIIRSLFSVQLWHGLDWLPCWLVRRYVRNHRQLRDQMFVGILGAVAV